MPAATRIASGGKYARVKRKFCQGAPAWKAYTTPAQPRMSSTPGRSQPGSSGVRPEPSTPIGRRAPGATVSCPEPGSTVGRPEPGATVSCPKPGSTVGCREPGATPARAQPRRADQTPTAIQGASNGPKKAKFA